MRSIVITNRAKWVSTHQPLRVDTNSQQVTKQNGSTKKFNNVKEGSFMVQDTPVGCEVILTHTHKRGLSPTIHHSDLLKTLGNKDIVPNKSWFIMDIMVYIGNSMPNHLENKPCYNERWLNTRRPAAIEWVEDSSDQPHSEGTSEFTSFRMDTIQKVCSTA